jgi:DNA polymerase-3 subunit delta'
MAFREITGHRRLVELLTRSIYRGSLPPSLIFAGPTGIGKRLTATALAQTLNCLAPETQADHSDACGACAACTRIARGVHPDVLVVEAGETGSIRIDQIREAVDRSAYKPFEGKRRVVIVDQADKLVVPAQNALLKVLEEPPPSSVFVLVTPRPDMLLATVRSRCIRLSFTGGAASALDGDARDVAERVLAHAAATPDPRRRIEGAKDLLTTTGPGSASDREQLASHLRAMESLLRDVELLAAGGEATALASHDVRPSLERLAAAYAGERGVRAFAAVDQALVALERHNAGLKLVADWVVLQL